MESLNRVESCGIIGGNRDRSASINNRNPLAPQTPINRYKCIRFKLDSTSILDGEGWAAMYSRDRTWITETGGIHLLFIFQSIISKDTMITRDNFYSFLIDIHVLSTMRIFLDDAFSFLLFFTLLLVSMINRKCFFLFFSRNFRCILSTNCNYINRNSGAYKGCCHGDDEHFGTPPSSPLSDPKIRIPSIVNINSTCVRYMWNISCIKKWNVEIEIFIYLLFLFLLNQIYQIYLPLVKKLHTKYLTSM